MPRKFRIPKRDLDIAAREEHKEHPWLTHKEARKVATDHLSKHPYYLQAYGVAERIMAKQEAANKPKRRRPTPNNNMDWINKGFLL